MGLGEIASLATRSRLLDTNRKEGPEGPSFVSHCCGAYGTISTLDVAVAVTVGNPPLTISLTFGSA